MNVIKRHKGLAIVGGLSLILMLIIFAIFAKMIFSDGSDIYGDRLNGKMAIDNKDTTKMIEETKALDEVEKVEVNVKGKIVYVIITFKEGTKLAKAKEVSTKTLTYYDEKILGYYDFEYLITEKITKSEDEKEEKVGFTAAGTKHPDLEKISWTKS